MRRSRKQRRRHNESESESEGESSDGGDMDDNNKTDNSKTTKEVALNPKQIAFRARMQRQRDKKTAGVKHHVVTCSLNRVLRSSSVPVMVLTRWTTRSSSAALSSRATCSATPPCR